MLAIDVYPAIWLMRTRDENRRSCLILYRTDNSPRQHSTRKKLISIRWQHAEDDIDARCTQQPDDNMMIRSEYGLTSLTTSMWVFVTAAFVISQFDNAQFWFHFVYSICCLCGVFSLLFLSFSFGWNNNNTNLAKFLHLIQYNDINAHTHTLAEIVYILATCCCRYVRFFSLVFFHCLYVSSSLDTHNSYRSIFDKLSWVSS